MLQNKLYIFFLIQNLLISSIFALDSVNLDEMSKMAQKENKHLLLYFHKKHCGFCKKMRTVTLKDDHVKDLIDQNFIFVDIGINDMGNILHEDFAGSKYAYTKSLEISLFPTVGFIDGNNTLVYGTIGYRDSESFYVILQYVNQRAYRTMELEEFIDNLEFEKDE